MSIRELIVERAGDEAVVFLEPNKFDSAIAGTTENDGRIIVIYDLNQILEILREDGMTEEDALDYWSYNMTSVPFIAYMTPVGD